MRPLRLEVEGFTSFRQNVVVDFSGLDLFAITGPTGAGKTSLIDAVIYALFGRTPRIGEKNASELISQGAERMKVLLQFRAANKNYQLLRTLKRGSSQKLQLEVQENGEWNALSNKVFEVRTQVEKILGIDFDGFTKSIVLPQGEFDRFLRGDPGERRRILSDLLRLGIYEEMGKFARQVEQSTRLEHSMIDQHIATAYAGVSEERKAELEHLLKESVQRQERASEELQLIHKAQPLIVKLSTQRAKLADATKGIAEVTEQLNKSTTSATSAKETAARHMRRLDKLNQLITACGYNSERHLELKSLLPQAQEREQCQRTIVDSQTEREKINVDIKRAKLEADKTKNAWEKLAQDLKLRDEAAQKAKEALDRAKKQYGSSDAILQVVQDLESAEEQLEEKQELQQSIEEVERKLDDTHQQLATLKRQHVQAVTALDEAKAMLENLQQQHAAMELRGQLKKGEACPVCDQIVAKVPALGKHVAIQRARTAVDEREKGKEKCSALLMKQEHLAESLPVQLKTMRKNLKTIDASITAATGKAERLLGKPPAKNAVEQLQKLANEIAKLETQNESNTAGLRSVQKSEAQAREAQLESEHRVRMLSQKLQILENNLAIKNERLLQLMNLLTGQPELSTLVEELKKMEKAKTEQHSYESEKKEQEALHQSSEKQYLFAEAEISGHKQRITQLQSSVTAIAASIKELEKEIREHLSLPKGVDEIDYLTQRRIGLEEETLKVTGEIVTAQKDLDSVIRALSDLADKRQQLNALKAKTELYRELGIALKADQFIQFVVEEAMSSLADHGSEQFSRLSSGRYSFTTEMDDFLVIDHWNADETRSVNTLSGGESFLASLSLALALGNSLVELSSESGRFSLESLFLDEGFSTLDPETLDVVVQAIETLAGGDKLIGIISHIPELSERFPAQIEVVKAVGGSTIRVRGDNRGMQKYVTA